MKTKAQILIELKDLADQLKHIEDRERSNYDAVYLHAPDDVLQTWIHNRMRKSLKHLIYSNASLLETISQLSKSINQNNV